MICHVYAINHGHPARNEGNRNAYLYAHSKTPNLEALEVGRQVIEAAPR